MSTTTAAAAKTTAPTRVRTVVVVVVGEIHDDLHQVGEALAEDEAQRVLADVGRVEGHLARQQLQQPQRGVHQATVRILEQIALVLFVLERHLWRVRRGKKTSRIVHLKYVLHSVVDLGGIVS